MGSGKVPATTARVRAPTPRTAVHQTGSGGRCSRVSCSRVLCPRVVAAAPIVVFMMVVLQANASGAMSGLRTPNRNELGRIATIEKCATKQLHVHYQRAVSVATVTYVTLAYTNVAAARCAISGWPLIVAIDNTGRSRTATHTGMLPTFQPELKNESRAPGVPTVVLRHGQSAYSFLAADGVYPNSSKRCPSYVRLLVSPPHNRQNATLSGWVASRLNGFIPACNHPVVSQVLPASDVRLFN